LLFSEACAGVRVWLLRRDARRALVPKLQFLISHFVRHGFDSQRSRQISSIHGCCRYRTRDDGRVDSLRYGRRHIESPLRLTRFECGAS
jgi:hypothetical protein